MIDPKQVLELADRYVEKNDRWAAFPSTDVMLSGVVESMTALVNAEIAKVSAGVVEILRLGLDPEVERSHLNFAIAELAKALGLEP